MRIKACEETTVPLFKWSFVKKRVFHYWSEALWRNKCPTTELKLFEKNNCPATEEKLREETIVPQLKWSSVEKQCWSEASWRNQRPTSEVKLHEETNVPLLKRSFIKIKQTKTKKQQPIIPLLMWSTKRKRTVLLEWKPCVETIVHDCWTAEPGLWMETVPDWWSGVGRKKKLFDCSKKRKEKKKTHIHEQTIFQSVYIKTQLCFVSG